MPQFQFADILASLRDVGIEVVEVGYHRNQEIAGTKSPVLLVQLGKGAPRVAELVHSPVVGATAEQLPIEKARSPVVGVGVAVEEVGYCQSSGYEGDPRDVLLAGELVGPVPDRLLLAA